MSTAEAAVVVAVVSAALSLITGISVELLRRRSVRQLEVLRSDYQRDLEMFKDNLTRTREADSKVEESRRLVAFYRDPLLRFAYDLQSRIYNIAHGYSGWRDPEYFRLNTLFLISQFFGWLEIIRKEMQFLDLGSTVTTVELNRKLHRVQDLFATTSTWRDDYYIYRGYQRAIGELMIAQIDPSTRPGPRCECIGYAAFASQRRSSAIASGGTVNLAACLVAGRIVGLLAARWPSAPERVPARTNDLAKTGGKEVLAGCDAVIMVNGAYGAKVPSSIT